MKYFDEYGMTSTHRRNLDLMSQCATEAGTTITKVKVWILCVNSLTLSLSLPPSLSLSLFLTSHVKNWIGSEVVKRKRKAGILPLPKFEFSSVSGSHERVLKCLIKKKTI